MRWPYFYTFHNLVDSYRNTITEGAVGVRYGNFTLKLAQRKKSLAYSGPAVLGRQAFLPIFGDEEISIPESQPIRKSYILRL